VGGRPFLQPSADRRVVCFGTQEIEGPQEGFQTGFVDGLAGGPVYAGPRVDNSESGFTILAFPREPVSHREGEEVVGGLESTSAGGEVRRQLIRLTGAMNKFDRCRRHTFGLTGRFQDPFENGMWKVFDSVCAKYRARCGPETGGLHTGGLHDWKVSQMKEPMM